MDGGSGTLQRAARAGLAPLAADGGFYSHRHPDHTGDLVPLLFGMRVASRQTPYPVVAGAGFGAFLDGLRGVYGKWIEPPGGVQLTELPLTRDHRLEIGPLLVHSAPANHGAGALHLRFEHGGRRVVFSGDTGPSEALVGLAHAVDLLVCECADADDDPSGKHLTPSDVAALVDAARPREVWLTHFYPHTDPEDAVARVAATGVSVRRARDGDVWPRA